MKRIFLALVILFTTKLFACECEQFNENNIEKLKKEVDYIFVGKVIKNINLENNQISEILWKKSNSSGDVIIQVEKIIKGEIEAKFIYLSQLNAGNCSRGFEKDKKYVISGYRINEFIDLSEKTEKRLEQSNEKKEIKKQKVKYEKLKSFKIEFEKNRFYLENFEMDFKKWNELAKTKILVLTSSCISGTIKSHFGKIITKEE